MEWSSKWNKEFYYFSWILKKILKMASAKVFLQYVYNIAIGCSCPKIY